MLDYCVQTTGSSYVDDRTCTHEASIAESKSAISLHESTLSCRVSWQPCWTHMLHNVDTLNVDMLLGGDKIVLHLTAVSKPCSEVGVTFQTSAGCSLTCERSHGFG